ncbi:MAG: hypothetical protein CMJ78_27700 [Planctomycetaceae bacterium]|nr:hypothetical protein [Planctomycetaceae bacterium]
METTLHRQLKEIYAPDELDREVRVDGFRIDGIAGNQLIEIQYGSLGAIRDKIRKLVKKHEVHIVKPLAARKYLITRTTKNGKVASSRYSPKRESFLDFFLDFVHFVNVFPHPNLTIELLLTEQEEHRIQKKQKRWRGKNHKVVDRKLVSLGESRELQTAEDLAAFLPKPLTKKRSKVEFTTADLTREADIPRWLAQKMAYCLRKTNVITTTGKQGNSLVYELKRPKRGRKRAA